MLTSLSKTLVAMGVAVISTASASAQTVKICSDINFWYPFTMVEDGKAVGIHIDIIRQALSNLKIDVEFKPLPWKRCLSEAEEGEVDAVATASFKDERAVFMKYPDDAKTAAKSPLRVSQVEYVVVTAAGNAYEYANDMKTIPQPIRAPRGYSIVGDLEGKGINVDSQASGDEFNVKKLLRDNKGSIVTIPEVITQLEKRPEYKGKFKVSKVPVTSKSYYLPFSKKSQIKKEQIDAIWAEIAKIRDDEDRMATIASKY